MPFPPLTAADLRTRLGVGPEVSDSDLDSCLAVSTAMVDPRCDPAKVDRHRDAYTEGCLQLAVKVWDTRARGMATLEADGTLVDFTAHATAGMYRSVLGILQPVLTSGGVIVG